jgi:hypothetical protein
MSRWTNRRAVELQWLGRSKLVSGPAWAIILLVLAVSLLTVTWALLALYFAWLVVTELGFLWGLFAVMLIFQAIDPPSD